MLAIVRRFTQHSRAGTVHYASLLPHAVRHMHRFITLPLGLAAIFIAGLGLLGGIGWVTKFTSHGPHGMDGIFAIPGILLGFVPGMVIALICAHWRARRIRKGAPTGALSLCHALFVVFWLGMGLALLGLLAYGFEFVIQAGAALRR